MSVNNGSSVYNEGGLTSDDVKALIDNALPTSGTATKTYSININGTAAKVRPDSLVNAYVDLSFSGVSWDDFIGIGSNSLFSKIPWDSNINRSAFIYGRITDKPNDWTTHVGTSGTNTYGLFTAYKSRDNYTVTIYPNYKGQAGTFGNAVVFFQLSSTVGIVSICKYVSVRGESAVGSPSIPVYIDSAGMVKECTNDFVHNDTMTDDNGDQMIETPPQQYYVTGKFYFVAGKVCRCTAYSAASATFDVYGVVEALNYVLSQT